MTREERGRLDVRHSPHNEAVNVVIPIHVPKLEVSVDERQISGMTKWYSASKTTHNTVTWALFPVSVDCIRLGRQLFPCTMAHKYETTLNGITCSRYGKLGLLLSPRKKEISPKPRPRPSPASPHLSHHRLRWFIETIRQEEEFNLYLIVLHYVWAECIVGRLGRRVAQVQGSQWLPLNDWLWGPLHIYYIYIIFILNHSYI